MSSARIPHGHPGFGKYRPIAILGRGGMATVYLATASGPGGFTKLVVIKELKPELAEEADFRSMFLEEARLAARLNHPNIVQTFEVVDDENVQFIVMEYLEGQSLRGLRGKVGALGDAMVAGQARIVADMLAGLHAAHELTDFDGQPLRVVHRDVSPHNVFVTYDGEVKLVDFGIAKAVDSSARTSTGAVKGKLAYMPPEQAFGLGVDRRADVFAAGVVLWEAATGKRLWEGLTEPGVLHRLSKGEIPRVRDVAPNAPA
jgi:serine/threonine protein kinase